MKGIRAYTHPQREKVAKALIPIITKQFGTDLIALAGDGSFARNEDMNYSDLELVVFVKQLPKEKWEIRKIEDGLLIVVITETQETYITKYLDISDVWYASGGGKLLPIINHSFIEDINNFKPANIEKKCLDQIRNRWYKYQEITAKVLNIIKEHNKEGLPLIFHEMIKELLIIMSFLNQTPYITLGTYITQAKQFPLKPKYLDRLLDITINNSYQNFSALEHNVEEVFTDLESIVEKKGLNVYSATSS